MKKKCIIISYAEKAFKKAQYPLIIKIPQQNSYRKYLLQHNKAMYKKPISNIIINGEKLNAFSPRSF